jgi:hypothetical protein
MQFTTIETQLKHNGSKEWSFLVIHPREKKGIQCSTCFIKKGDSIDDIIDYQEFKTRRQKIHI